MSDGPQRRLTAIVAADVVGYSRVMRADETGALAILRNRRSELIDPLIDKHGGRIVKTMSDGLLLEFPSVVAAVECAIATQEGIVERNEDIPDSQAIGFRIGVHIGDSVNVAASIEPLAEPDGVSLSDDAYRQAHDRLDVVWEDGGEHHAMNIVRSIQVWRWLDSGRLAPGRAPFDGEPPELPDKLSIAVLPFQSRSEDPEQEIFVYGMTEDLITDLKLPDALQRPCRADIPTSD